MITLEGVAAILTSLGALVWSIRSFHQARHANRAVNAISPGEPTLKDRIERIETTVDDLRKGNERRYDAQTNQFLTIQRELGRLSAQIESLL